MDESEEKVITTLDPQPERDSSAKSKIFGLLIVLGIVVSWVGSGEFASYSEQNMNYQKNFFFVYILDTWNILILPLYCLFSFVSDMCKEGSVTSPLTKLKSDMTKDNMSFKKLCLTALVSTFNQFVADYGYFRALSLTSASSGIVIFNLSTIFAYILSLVILKESFSVVKSLSVVLAFGGAAAITLSDQITIDPPPNAPPAWVGDLIMGGSALFWALYLVCFKKFVGEPSFGTINLQTTLMGVFNTFLLWPFLIILHYTKVEVFELPPTSFIWMCVMVTTGLGFINNYLFNFGTAVTSPVFVTIGGMLAIPGTAVVDWILRGIKMTELKIIGTVIMAIAFLMINVDLVEATKSCVKSVKKACGCDSQYSIIN